MIPVIVIPALPFGKDNATSRPWLLGTSKRDAIGDGLYAICRRIAHCGDQVVIDSAGEGMDRPPGARPQAAAPRTVLLPVR